MRKDQQIRNCVIYYQSVTCLFGAEFEKLIEYAKWDNKFIVVIFNVQFTKK